MLAADVLGVATIVALGYFATVYTDRSTVLSEPRNAALVCWAVVALAGTFTQPLFGLFYESVSYRDGPIPYLATEPGPIYLLSTAVAVGVLAVSIGYLARLFVESAHRSSSSILLLTAAGVLTLLPNIVSSLGLVRVLPGYDYTVFGVVPFTFVLGYTVFFRGELDLTPVARNEIVEDIDDVLFGVDDQGRVGELRRVDGVSLAR